MKIICPSNYKIVEIHVLRLLIGGILYIILLLKMWICVFSKPCLSLYETLSNINNSCLWYNEGAVILIANYR